MLPLRVLELIVILVCVVDCSRALTTQEPVAVQTLQNQSWHHQSSVPEPSSAGGTSMRNKHKGKSVTTPSWEGRDDISPFKLAEKRLKRYKGKQTDFSGVLDFARDRFASGTEHRTKSLVKRQAESDLSRATESGPVTGEEKVAGNGVEVVAVPGCEGLCILPGFLTEEEQLQLAERCLADYPTPEHRSNLTPQHGRIERLWETREDLLEQLRWVTLGYQYDWTNRTYPPEHRVAVPCELVKYAEAASEAAGCSAVRAEAVIVNYYSLHSTLGGHLDDVEPDQTSAIVSISLGCAGVFLGESPR
jgi:alkylated DNA repair protein alkB family protein 1